MILYLLGFFYIAASFLSRKHYNAYLGLLLVLLVMGFQSGVRGDYDGYQSLFNYMSFDNVDLMSIREENGWLILNILYEKLGLSFQTLVFSISLIQYLILAKFINVYADSKFKFVTGLIFYFSINMMLFQMKGLRQGLAVDLCLASIMCLEQRKQIISVLFVLIAYTMHTSTLLFIPFLLLYVVVRNSNWINRCAERVNLRMPVFITALYLLLFLSKEMFFNYIQPILLGMNLMGYEGYFGKLELVSYHPLITIYGCVVTFATSWYMTQVRGIMRYFSFLTLLSLFIEMLFFGLGDLFRFSLFFGIFSIVIFPNIASLLNNNGKKNLSWAFAMLCVAYAWRTFITWTIRNSPDGFDNYQFLFF